MTIPLITALELLEACEQFLYRHADIDGVTEEGHTVPNDAMCLQILVNDFLKEVKGWARL